MSNFKKHHKFVLQLFVFMIIFLVPFLSACRTKEERREMTGYIGSSVKTLSRRADLKLSEVGNGVYVLEDTVQVIAPQGKITSVTLLKNAGELTLLGVRIGMDKKEAELLFQTTYGKETSKKINATNNCISYAYENDKNELFVSYDIDTEAVTEISYYDFKNAEVEDNSDVDLHEGQMIAIVGNVRVYYNEAMVYLKSVQENYETNYGKDIWKTDLYGDKKTFGEIIKEEVIKQITELKIIRDKAEEYGVFLEEDELAAAKSFALEHYEGMTAEDISKYFITLELLEKVYADNLLAEKMFENLTINVDTDVPDEEAKQVTIQHIFVKGTGVDEQGNTIPLAGQERETALNKANKLLQDARTTEDFYTLAEANTEAEEIEFTFGKGTGPEEYSDLFEQTALSLRTGEVSNLVETDYGWHILYCVTDFNEDATTQIKENIIEQRRTEMFAKLYEDWSPEYDIVINLEAWNKVTFED